MVEKAVTFAQSIMPIKLFEAYETVMALNNLQERVICSALITYAYEYNI